MTLKQDDRPVAGGNAPARMGRSRATSAAELGRIGLDLFVARGFDAVTVDDIATAAGIGRRTFFRYYASKNDLPWGDFEELLAHLRSALESVPATVPMMRALRRAIVSFNTFPSDEMPMHRRRMTVLLGSETLVAHSALRYAKWREVVSDFAAHRLGLAREHVLPNMIARTCLAISLAAYEEWLRDEDHDLPAIIDAGYAGLGEVFAPLAEAQADSLADELPTEGDDL